MLAAAAQMRQALVIDTQQMQDGRVQIVNMDLVLHDGLAGILLQCMFPRSDFALNVSPACS